MNGNTTAPLHNTLAFFRLSSPQQSLNTLVKLWFVAALVGQWFFAVYVFLISVLPVISGKPMSADFSHMITGLIVGDDKGNFILFAHLMPAAILSFCGVLQLVPHIKLRYLAFHRWNGRLFLLLGLIGALTGLYLTWIRGSRLSDIGAVGVTINGLLIPIAVYLAWQYARKGKFDAHKRWAVHSFMLVNGVWTLRLYLMGWFIVNQGPNGNNDTLDGPADMFFSFACYLLPMLIVELVFWAKKQGNTLRVVGVSIIMGLGTVITAIGVIGAAAFMWLPRIQVLLMNA